MDLFGGLARVEGNHLLQLGLEPLDLPGSQLDIRDLTLSARVRLVNEDPRMWQGKALAFGPSS